MSVSERCCTNEALSKGVRENTVTHTQKSEKSSLPLRNNVSIWLKHATLTHSYIHYPSQQNYHKIRSLNHENDFRGSILSRSVDMSYWIISELLLLSYRNITVKKALLHFFCALRKISWIHCSNEITRCCKCYSGDTNETRQIDTIVP